VLILTLIVLGQYLQGWSINLLNTGFFFRQTREYSVTTYNNLICN